MDGSPVIILLAPIAAAILIPLGINTYHLAAIFIFTCILGMVTPPVGIVLYTASAITGVPVANIFRDIWAFFLPTLVTLLIITFFPAIVLFLPKILGLI